MDEREAPTASTKGLKEAQDLAEAARLNVLAAIDTALAKLIRSRNRETGEELVLLYEDGSRWQSFQVQ